MGKRVLNVGQCGMDHGSIMRLLGQEFDAEVVSADLEPEVMAVMRRQHFDLVLVNRLLDADGSDGLKVIRSIKADPRTADTPVMLVSNYPEYQEQAVAVGAEPGFGKRDLGSAETRAALSRFLE